MPPLKCQKKICHLVQLPSVGTEFNWFLFDTDILVKNSKTLFHAMEILIYDLWKSWLCTFGFFAFNASIVKNQQVTTLYPRSLDTYCTAERYSLDHAFYNLFIQIITIIVIVFIKKKYLC